MGWVLWTAGILVGLLGLLDRRPTLTRALDGALEEMGLARILEELGEAGPVPRPA